MRPKLITHATRSQYGVARRRPHSVASANGVLVDCFMKRVVDFSEFSYVKRNHFSPMPAIKRLAVRDNSGELNALAFWASLSELSEELFSPRFVSETLAPARIRS